MRTIERSSAFRRDYKRAKATPRHVKDLDPLLSAILSLLLSDRPLPASSRDHTLSGDWSGYRECHLKPDLLLIYRKPSDDTLRLARLGSHSDLFG
jgi:mRNA interferase YafQ